MKKTVQNLRALKQTQEKFSVVAAYDATFTQALNQAGTDAILVGDSLGMVVQGKQSTVPVTIDEMVYHTAAVVRSNDQSEQQALIIADLPFMTYDSLSATLENSAKLMRAGANMVKLEGGEWLAESVSKLVELGIPVCAHIGLTPQSVNKFGGYKVQGRSEQQQTQLLADAKILDQAGADFIVLECIPSKLAKTITENTGFSTIGIGAGSATDAQVLVSYDLLGLSPHPAKFVKDFLADAAQNGDQPASVVGAFKAYNDAVKSGEYPGSEHEYQ